MFNSHFAEFDEDPFFSDPFRAQRQHMRQMMRSISEPFGGPFMPSVMDGRNWGQEMVEHPSSDPPRNNHRDMMRSPFGMFDSMMANMRNRMEEMHQNFENVTTDSSAHSFSSSSVMTYSKCGNEPPKVFQATSSTRCAPGGIKETRQAVKDSESGLEKMRIGHHIQDRGRVVEKKVNQKTGEKEFIQDFQNMDESEAQSFDEEWQQEVFRFHPSGPTSRSKERRLRGGHQAPITGPQQSHQDEGKGKAEGKAKKGGLASTKR
ncbi:myeloid leukemia factor 1 isoform 2-T2 [Pholidichthys leucotaenia]